MYDSIRRQSLLIDIAGMVCGWRVHHWLTTTDTHPRDFRFVFSCCINGPLCYFFDIILFRGAISFPDALILTRFQWITHLPCSILRWLLLLLRFLREVPVSPECQFFWIESTSLANSIDPWLVSAINLTVLLSTLDACEILLSFVGVFDVANAIQIVKGFCFDVSSESWHFFRNWPLRRSVWYVLELWFLDFLISSTLSPSSFCHCTLWPVWLAHNVLSRINVRVADCTTCEFTKRLFCALAWNDCKSFV